MSTAIAVVLLLAIATYAVFGGADFGAGFWDLTAGGPERGEAPCGLIEWSIGPVWEANHVWLIFIFVLTWSAFPSAYASITFTMFVPLTIAALGIVLRGASFAFRKPSSRFASAASSVAHLHSLRYLFPSASARSPVARPGTPSTAG